MTEFEKITPESALFYNAFQWQKPGRNRAYLWQVHPGYVAVSPARRETLSNLRPATGPHPDKMLEYCRKKTNFRNPGKSNAKAEKTIIEFLRNGCHI